VPNWSSSIHLLAHDPYLRDEVQFRKDTVLAGDDFWNVCRNETGSIVSTRSPSLLGAQATSYRADGPGCRFKPLENLRQPFDRGLSRTSAQSNP
jgi:hypothetical protein